MTRIPGVDTGFFPSWTRSSSPGPLANARLTMVPAGNGGFQLRASGLVPDALYFLQSSPDLGPGSFGTPQTFTGEQLMSGITVTPATTNRFYRLTNSSAR